MAFDGVRTPESASFAGQAGLSHSLASQNTPKCLLDRFPSQRPQVSPPVGKPELPAPTVNRSTVGHWGVVAIQSGRIVPIVTVRSIRGVQLRNYDPTGVEDTTSLDIARITTNSKKNTVGNRIWSRTATRRRCATHGGDRCKVVIISCTWNQIIRLGDPAPRRTPRP